MVTSIEQHVEWISQCLAHLRDTGHELIEASPDAQDRWVAHNAKLVEGRLSTDPSCASWYLGANVPGKPRVYMPYGGGHPYYRQRCDEVVANGYEGFLLT